MTKGYFVNISIPELGSYVKDVLNLISSIVTVINDDNAILTTTFSLIPGGNT